MCVDTCCKSYLASMQYTCIHTCVHQMLCYIYYTCFNKYNLCMVTVCNYRTYIKCLNMCTFCTYLLYVINISNVDLYVYITSTLILTMHNGEGSSLQIVWFIFDFLAATMLHSYRMSS